MEILGIEIIKETATVVKFKVDYRGWFGSHKTKTFMITSLTCGNHCLHDYKGETIYGSGFLDKIIIYVKLHDIQSITKFTHIIK